MRTLVKLLSWLPLWLLYSMGWLLGWSVFLLSKKYRNRFLSHSKQAGYRFAQISAAVGSAGKAALELPRVWLGRPVHFELRGSELVEQALQAGSGIILLTPHLGCFEVVGQAYASRFHQQGFPITTLFRPARQIWLRELMEYSRKRANLQLAATNMSGVKSLIKALHAGHTVGLLPDQVPPLGLGVWVPFFDRPAYTMTLAARLAQQTGAKIILTWGERLSFGRGYVVHYLDWQETLSNDAEQAATQINAAMETLIRQAPDQYLWEYPRYKLPKKQ